MDLAESRAPLAVYLLAEHLDAMLAAGEDLVSRGQEWQTAYLSTAAPADFAREQRDAAEAVRALELMVVVRTLKAREHARDLAEIDPRFRAVANLFASGTTVLLDAVSECGDARSDDFDTGDELIAYVRSRELIAPDAVTLQTAAQLTVDDAFLVAKRIALGPLLDMAAAFLDALETHYELFAEDGEDATEGERMTAGTEKGRRDRLPFN